MAQRRAEVDPGPYLGRLWAEGFLERELASGRLELLLWRPEADEEQGLVVWQRVGPASSKVLSAWVEPGHRTEAALSAMVSEFTTTADLPPCVAFPDRSPGYTAELLARALGPRSFRHVERVRLELDLERYPVARPPPGVELRGTRSEDRDALLRLFQSSYGRDADTLFGAHLDPERDAREYLDDEILANPEWDRDASYVAETGGRAVGSVLVQRTTSHPLIADLMVDPVRRRAGVGSALLAASVRALRGQGATRAELTVTLSNPNEAYAFYRRRGFEPVRDPRRAPGGLWVSRRFLEERGIRLLPEAATPRPE